MIRGLPSTAKIGFRTYRLVWWPAADAAAEDMRGQHDGAACVIRISDDLTPPAAAETLLHELLHACWRNVALTGDVEENAVSTLADNLAQVWADNPAVFAWMSKNLRRECARKAPRDASNRR